MKNRMINRSSDENFQTAFLHDGDPIRRVLHTISIANYLMLVVHFNRFHLYFFLISVKCFSLIAA